MNHNINTKATLSPRGNTFKAYNQKQPWKKYQNAPYVCWCGLRFFDENVLNAHKKIGHK